MLGYGPKYKVEVLRAEEFGQTGTVTTKFIVENDPSLEEEQEDWWFIDDAWWNASWESSDLSLDCQNSTSKPTPLPTPVLPFTMAPHPTLAPTPTATLPAPTPTPIPTGPKEGQPTPDGQLIYSNGAWQLLVPITPTPVPTPEPTLIPKELYSYADVAKLGLGDYGASITELLWQEYGVIGQVGRLVPPIDEYLNVDPLEQ